MTRHLKTCLEQPPSVSAGGSGKPPKTQEALHLLVEGAYARSYWLHLALTPAARFRDLDDFLRAIWLECCGHLSAFEIAGTQFTGSPSSESEFGERDMNEALGIVLRPGMQFTHEYDFGSTTTLALKVVSERDGEVKAKNAIRVLARNHPPPIPCSSCGQPATKIIAEEADDESGWLCDPCASKCERDEGEFLPVVNSPRTGVCGYTG